MAASSISEEGLQAMKENGIELEDLKIFTELDVHDLFTVFKDRMIVRKFIQSGSEFATASQKLNAYGQEKSIGEELVALSGSPSISEGEGLTSNYQFKAEELLEERPRGQKCTAAQRHFNNLIKDAAVKAHIWSKARPLADILSKKEPFLSEVVKNAPCLESKRSVVWKCLGKHLQNRRKYLKDKQVGKRVSKKKAKVAVSSDNGLPFKTGEVLSILNKNNRPIGTGIYIQPKDGQSAFSEIVLKSKKKPGSDCSKSELDVELPQTVPDGSTNFAYVGLKQIITYPSRLLHGSASRGKGETENQNTGGKKPAPNPVKSSPLISVMNAKPNPVKSSTLNPVNSSAPIPVKNTIPNPAKRSRATPNPVENDLPVIKRRTQTPKRKVGMCESKSMPKNTKKTKKEDFRSIVLMEWNSGKVYWGIKQVAHLTDFLLIQNCVKPSGKIVNKRMDFEMLYKGSSDVKLSPTDTEVNPDMRYCIWEMSPNNGIIEVTETESGTGSKSVQVDVICAKSQFVDEVKKQFVKYMQS